MPNMSATSRSCSLCDLERVLARCESGASTVVTTALTYRRPYLMRECDVRSSRGAVLVGVATQAQVVAARLEPLPAGPRPVRPNA